MSAYARAADAIEVSRDFQLATPPGQRVGLRINNANVVCAVHPESVADKAGLKEGDVVTAVDGEPCVSGDQVTAVTLWAQGSSRTERSVRVVRVETPRLETPPPPADARETESAAAEMDERIRAIQARSVRQDTLSPEKTPRTSEAQILPWASPLASPSALPAELQAALRGAENLKADGNRALSGGFLTLAEGLYTKAIARLEARVPPGPSPQIAMPTDVAVRMEQTRQLLVSHLSTYYSNRASARQALELYEGALADAHEVVRLRPDWVKGYARRGDALASLGRAADAADAYVSALAIEPSNQVLGERLANARATAVYNAAGTQSARIDRLSPAIPHDSARRHNLFAGRAGG